jgi:hypothetical protein
LRQAFLLAALTLIPAAPATAGTQSAATLYALNCMGCHIPPDEIRRQAPPMTGQFAQTEGGRIFFIRLPDGGDRLPDKVQEERLLREVMGWKKSCTVISQDAAMLKYTGAR